VRVRTLSSTIFCSLTILSVVATPAMAASKTGGVAAVVPTPAASGGSTPTTPATPVKPLVHTDPVTAPTPNIAYTGPVYEKTVTGQIVPYVPPAPTGEVNGTTGGMPVGTAADTKPQLLVPGMIARYVNGLAAAPISVPAAVQEIIWAGNELIGLPYIYGGGHASFISPGYDCSGTVSFALHGANLLQTPEDSSEFEVWGSHGAGRWVTIFANGGHAYMTVAGLRLDTSAADDPSNEQGPRWRPLRQGNEGFVVRHPLGL
jgi:cell wall-associated NlpC family hydrolase